jgi:hypothetical protein
VNQPKCNKSYILIKLAVAISLAFSIASCAVDPDAAKVSGLKSTTTTPTNPGPRTIGAAIFEANTEAGLEAVATSTNFQMSKSVVGGPYEKAKSTSANFILKGGVYYGL